MNTENPNYVADYDRVQRQRFGDTEPQNLKNQTV